MSSSRSWGGNAARRKARRSRDTALEGSRRYEQLDRRRVADLKTSQESFSQRRTLRDDCDRLVHQRDQLRDQLIDEEDEQRKLRREIGGCGMLC